MSYDAIEKLWKAREEQLKKVLLNAAHIRGSMEGISCTDNIQLSLTDDQGAFIRITKALLPSKYRNQSGPSCPRRHIDAQNLNFRIS